MSSSFFVFDSPNNCSNDCLSASFAFPNDFYKCMIDKTNCLADVFVDWRYHRQAEDCASTADATSLATPVGMFVDLVETIILGITVEKPLDGEPDLRECASALKVLACSDSDCDCPDSLACSLQNSDFENPPIVSSTCSLYDMTKTFYFIPPRLGRPMGNLQSWTNTVSTPKFLALGLTTGYATACRNYTWPQIHLALVHYSTNAAGSLSHKFVSSNGVSSSANPIFSSLYFLLYLFLYVTS